MLQNKNIFIILIGLMDKRRLLEQIFCIMKWYLSLLITGDSENVFKLAARDMSAGSNVLSRSAHMTSPTTRSPQMPPLRPCCLLGRRKRKRLPGTSEEESRLYSLSDPVHTGLTQEITSLQLLPEDQHVSSSDNSGKDTAQDDKEKLEAPVLGRKAHSSPLKSALKVRLVIIFRGVIDLIVRVLLSPICS